MRVLIVFFGKDYHGGTTYSTFTIAKDLVRRGHDVHAYVRVTPAGVLSRDLESCGVIVHDGAAPNLTHPLREPRPAYKAIRLAMEQYRRHYLYPKSEREVEAIVRSCGIDLIVISSGATVTGSLASKRTGVPFIWHRREFMQEDHGLDYYPWARFTERMGEASRLVCVSKAVEEKMLGICPTARTEVVYNGIDQAVFNPEGREEHVEGTPLRLMISGGIRRDKGAFLLLDALSLLGPDTPVTLDVYGAEGGGAGEREGDFLARATELGLSDRVRYHGSVSNIADELRRHDIQVVASRAEAFGRVTAEAMLCGCAVVGSNSGGTPELISNDRGYLFDSGDAQSLAHALREAATDQAERAARAERALAYARENFSVKAYVDKVEAIYRAVAP
ncbi:MAG: glycosyltransferase family 4 protein [Atopobiaceae bacterium]|nr:glycosyltransferase family 4 protein [Atopobiaceae bacterium]